MPESCQIQVLFRRRAGSAFSRRVVQIFDLNHLAAKQLSFPEAIKPPLSLPPLDVALRFTPKAYHQSAERSLRGRKPALRDESIAGTLSDITRSVKIK